MIHIIIHYLNGKNDKGYIGYQIPYLTFYDSFETLNDRRRRIANILLDKLCK